MIKNILKTIITIAVCTILPYYAGHYATNWLFPYFAESKQGWQDMFLDWVFGIAVCAILCVAALIIYAIYCAIFNKEEDIFSGYSGGVTTDISDISHPLNPANPASPNSLMNPLNPASPVSPFNPMNNINSML